MKKRILLTLLLLPLIFTLAACSKKTGSVPGQNATISVKSGQYSVTEDGSRLALKLKLTNDSYKEEINTISDYFVLVDNDGNKVSGSSSYSDGDLNADKVAKGENTQGYVYFKAKKNTKYTLKFSSYDEKVKTNKIEINTKKYKDNTESPRKAIEAVINEVLLDKKDKNFDKYVANDKDEMKSDFKEKMDDYLKETVFMDNVEDSSVDTVAKAVKKFNADNGEVSVKVKSMSADKATVEVKTKTINLDNLEDTVSDLQDEKFDAALDADSDTDAAETAASTEVANKISDYLQKDDLKSSEAYTVELQKEDGKWKIDTSEDEFDMLSELFMGQVY